MVERLVLGTGPLVETVASNLDDARVGTADEAQVTHLRESGLRVEELDPTDPDTLAALGADVVAVVGDTSAVPEIARAVREGLPDAHLLICSNAAGVESVADTVVDPTEAVATGVRESVSDPRVAHLWRVLDDIDNLAVVMHDNPDPDAIASGLALARIARATGCDAEVCYYGDISHQENRAFVNVLDIELRRLGPDETLSAVDGFALVDHARPGINDGLSPETAIDVVIDHPPPRGPVEGRFVDLRSDVGATSTLLVEYLDRLGLGFEATTATALLFGIQVDTDGFVRGVTQADFDAAATLVESADLDLLSAVETSTYDVETMDILSRAITNRRVDGELLFSFVGAISNRDALAQAADELLMLDGTTTTVVYGIREETVYLSARSGSTLDVGEAVREALDWAGSGGGHADMAGAQLDANVLRSPDDDRDMVETVRDDIPEYFLAALEPGRPSTPSGYDPDEMFERYRAGDEPAPETGTE
jgi:nanoRNase/pAp phosphatase (c-di-AMP/oligoRNAs hydrolase)